MGLRLELGMGLELVLGRVGVGTRVGKRAVHYA